MKEQEPEQLYFVRAVGPGANNENIVSTENPKQALKIAAILRNRLFMDFPNLFPDPNLKPAPDPDQYPVEIWIAKRWKPSIWQRFRDKLSFFK